jgi:F420-non-reducing hydrogenase iron-sulfur subunit
MSKSMKNIGPSITAFICNWSGCTAIDLNDLESFQHPPSIRIIRMICSGRIQPALILDAFNQGNDGVLVCGCHLGDCHYISGNEKAEEYINKTKKLLDLLRIEKERLRLEWVSPSEGRAKFINIVKDFTQQLISLGSITMKV